MGNIPWNKPMSLQTAKEIIRWEMGWKALRNYLEAVELEKQRRIIKRKPNRHRTTHRVTLGAIARHAPEIVPPDILGDRGGEPNNRAIMTALADVRAKQEERMAEVARDVFEARIRPVVAQLSELRGGSSGAPRRKKTKKVRKPAESRR